MDVNFENNFESAVELLESNQLTKAKEDFLELDKKYKNVGVKMNLALIEMKLENNSVAVDYAKSALKIDPTNIAIARFLESLTNDTIYTKMVNEMNSKIIKVNSKKYYIDFKNRALTVNSEYARFKIEITGKIVEKENRIIYLKGTKEIKNESVICWQIPFEIYEKSHIGDTISFIGISYGIGEELSDPVIIFKEIK